MGEYTTTVNRLAEYQPSDLHTRLMRKHSHFLEVYSELCDGNGICVDTPDSQLTMSGDPNIDSLGMVQLVELDTVAGVHQGVVLHFVSDDIDESQALVFDISDIDSLSPRCYMKVFLGGLDEARRQNYVLTETDDLLTRDFFEQILQINGYLLSNEGLFTEQDVFQLLNDSLNFVDQGIRVDDGVHGRIASTPQETLSIDEAAEGLLAVPSAEEDLESEDTPQDTIGEIKEESFWKSYLRLRGVVSLYTGKCGWMHGYLNSEDIFSPVRFRLTSSTLPEYRRDAHKYLQSVATLANLCFGTPYMKGDVEKWVSEEGVTAPIACLVNPSSKYYDEQVDSLYTNVLEYIEILRLKASDNPAEI